MSISIVVSILIFYLSEVASSISRVESAQRTPTLHFGLIVGKYICQNNKYRPYHMRPSAWSSGRLDGVL
jgi:hypothetical protein